MKILLLLTCIVSLLVSCASPPPRLNILFIFTDDHACQAISAYGSQINRTPNIDRLAQEGMLFNRCYVTNAICEPSRAVIQTGKYSHLNGVHTNFEEFDGSQQTFPKLLQAQGYETALIGKWHLKSIPTGFDYAEVLPGQGKYYNPAFLIDGKTVEYEGYATDIITDKALSWLKESHNPDRPFMLMVQHKAPHRAWEPGPDHLTLYAGDTIPEPPTLFDDYANRSSALRMQKLSIAEILDEGDLKIELPRNLTPEQRVLWERAYAPVIAEFRSGALQGEELVRWKYQQYIKDYLRCIASVDDNTGRLLDYLDASGLAGNTVVVYASDQGFFLGEHGLIDKRFMYEESLRAPLIVRWPGVAQPGSACDALVSNLDFAQTFLDIAGVPQPDDMQGRSIAPLLRGTIPPDWRMHHYYHFYEEGYGVLRHEGVTDGVHKLIHYYDTDEWEYFERQSDPLEMMNRYDDLSCRETVIDLKATMEQLKNRYQVPPPMSIEAQRAKFQPGQ